MALRTTAKTGSAGDFKRCPVGNHPAVCVAVIGAGTHTQQFPGKPARDEEKVIFVWEVEADDPESGQAARFHILKDYNLYFTVTSKGNKSNLRQLVEGWFPSKTFAEGEDVDLTKLKGQPCLLAVVEKDGYPRMDSAKPLVKGMKAIKPSVEPFAWDVGDGTDYPSPEWVPYIWGKPMLDYIRECHEMAGNGKTGDSTSFPHGANEPDVGDEAKGVF